MVGGCSPPQRRGFPKGRAPGPLAGSGPGRPWNAIKDLLSRYPLDAWRFLLPDIAQKLGDPSTWEIMRSEARKHDLRRKGWVMDLPIRYAFPGGQDLVVVVLIEHWATSRSVNLHRTARYVLDLMEREPGRSVVPVALVTELMPGPVRERLELGHPTESEPILSFRHVLRIVAQEDLDRWRKASNVVASVLVPAMRGKLGTPDKARISFLGLEALLEADEVMRLAPILFSYG